MVFPPFVATIMENTWAIIMMLVKWRPCCVSLKPMPAINILMARAVLAMAHAGRIVDTIVGIIGAVITRVARTIHIKTAAKGNVLAVDEERDAGATDAAVVAVAVKVAANTALKDVVGDVTNYHPPSIHPPFVLQLVETAPIYNGYFPTFIGTRDDANDGDANDGDANDGDANDGDARVGDGLFQFPFLF